MRKLLVAIVMFTALCLAGNAFAFENFVEDRDCLDGPIFNGESQEELGGLVDSTAYVGYSYRYTIKDSNNGDLDYIYVFRISGNHSPAYLSLWARITYLGCGSWYNVTSWAMFWNSYYKNGSLYIEYLMGKGRTDWGVCGGYIVLGYSY